MNPYSNHNSNTYNVGRNQQIIAEGEQPSSLKLLLKGRIEAFMSSGGKPLLVSSTRDVISTGYKLFDIDQNIFIGANDLFTGSSTSLTYTAATDCSLFSCQVQNRQETEELIEKQKDYGAYIINSICSLIISSHQVLSSVHTYCTSIECLFRNLCAFYVSLTDTFELSELPGIITETGKSALSALGESGVIVPSQFSRQFAEAEEAAVACPVPEDSDLRDEIEFYTHMYNISSDIRKAFFSADTYVTCKHASQASICLERILQELRQIFIRFENTVGLLYSLDDNNIYSAFMKAAFEMKDKGFDHTPALDAAAYLLGRLKDISSYMEFEYKHNTGIDFDYFEHMHSDRSTALDTSTTSKDGSDSPLLSAEELQSLPDELNNSAVKILEYSEISEEKSTCFLMNLTAFRNLKDRLSADEQARTVRKAVTDSFFEIYTEVFRKAHRTGDESRLIRMFLSYGYMDEKLLDIDQVMAIYRLAGMDHSAGCTGIYFMHEWLGEIYRMSKDPSVNNFGHDYTDTFRELKKHGRLTDKDKPAYMNNREDRLTFEINNMLKTNHKLCQGQISQYFPILHKDSAPYDPCRSFISPSVISEKLSAILETDYSIFHREIHYRDANTGIEKEIVMSKVMPDILLMPVYGTRAMMWQEITGRVRNSPGRFILPVFTDESIDDILIRLTGNFRWELCRTMMGAAWNDITQSSLTSEYADYIQFYRKNRDLTEEAREKVKALISRHHNKLRDIFTSEYEIWICNESKGNPRLNRVARSIFSKHCPFSLKIREQLERQPIYSDLISIFNIQRSKKVRELENRYKNYIKTNGSLDPVLQENLDFYKNL